MDEFSIVPDEQADEYVKRAMAKGSIGNLAKVHPAALVRALARALIASHTGEAEPVSRDAKTWCAYVSGIIETYINSNPAREVRETAIAGIIERRLWALPSATPPAATPAAPGEVAPLTEAPEGWEFAPTPPGSGWKLVRAAPCTHNWIYNGKLGDYACSICHAVKGALSHPAPVAEPASVPQAIDQLVSALAESKGWMRDYARALIEDAIDRRHLEVAAPAPASEAVQPRDWSFAGWFLNSGKPDEPCWEQVASEFSQDADVVALGFWAHPEIAIPTTGDSVDAPVQQAGEAEAKAKKLYTKHTDNHPTIHCNRFPAWDELSATERDEWRAKARAALKGEQPAQPSGSERGEV